MTISVAVARRHTDISIVSALTHNGGQHPVEPNIPSIHGATRAAPSQTNKSRGTLPQPAARP
ncbi:hypothetical protein [Burkholderia pyrrocinia]|uniref:Uncharacterized protein n=1 Tax=Burkholderia pyrrocinia TaxID=60550 RepID=A0ABZ3BPP8_BURPY